MLKYSIINSFTNVSVINLDVITNKHVREYYNSLQYLKVDIYFIHITNTIYKASSNGFMRLRRLILHSVSSNTNNFFNPLKTQVVVYHLIRCVAICAAICTTSVVAQCDSRW
jgi:hypothetical protein